jgi:hypothetical protein
VFRLVGHYAPRTAPRFQFVEQGREAVKNPRFATDVFRVAFEEGRVKFAAEFQLEPGKPDR